MAEKPLLYDGFGLPAALGKRPPAERISTIVGERDPWAGSSTGAINPSLLAAVLRGDADLTMKNSVLKKIVNDDHVFASLRILANTTSRLDWEFLPVDDSREAKKDAVDATKMMNGLRWRKGLIKYLVFGEFYPFNSGELLWNTKTYVPDGFERINPERWTWDRLTNAPRLRTKRSPYKGEELPPWGFITHRSALEPGNLLEAGMGVRVAWLWLFKHSSWEYLMRFAEAFGNPHIWAFFQRPEDEKTVFDGVKALAGNARAAFPEGTEIKMAEAQRYGTVAVYREIREASEGGISKVVLGHVLNTDSKPGSGTLAGNYADKVSQENKEGVAEGISETIQQGLVAPWWGFNRGWDRVLSNELPIFTIKCKPPVDLAQKAKTYVDVNTGLAAVGKAIDPSQYEDEFAVRTVDLPKPEQQQGDDEEEDADPPGKKKKRKAKVTAAAKRAPKIKNVEDVETASVKLVRKACEDFGDRLTELFQQAGSIEAGVDALWEGYNAMDTTRLASAMRDTTVTANVIGRGDAGDE